MVESKGVTFRPKQETLVQLDALAAATDRSKSWHVQQAVEGYLEHHAWQIGHIKQGLADAKAGRVTDDEAVADWLHSWGTESEKDAPL
tara:strand:+ start:2559 stop:2822 length:264 start_codon:yes stop_codon:yes gene_type:complete